MPLHILIVINHFFNQPAEGISKRAGDSVEVVHTYNDWDTEAAAELAKDADIAFVFSKASAGEEYLMVDGNNDRKNLTLWNNGDNLVSIKKKNYIYKRCYDCFQLFKDVNN